MKILLREDMEKLGRRGDVVKVAPGYARNYLLPKGIAMRVTPGNMKLIDQERHAIQLRYDREKVSAEEMARRVARINPRCAFFHRAMGDAFSGIHQYPASEREYLKAIELDPTDANARTELGMMYMLWGEEQKALPEGNIDLGKRLREQAIRQKAPYAQIIKSWLQEG